VTGSDAFAKFDTAGYARVAWALRVIPRGDRDSRIEIEVRVDATDDASWRKFRRYFRVIGIGSRFIRHTLLGSLAKELGSPEAAESERPLDGDDLLPVGWRTRRRKPASRDEDREVGGRTALPR